MPISVLQKQVDPNTTLHLTGETTKHGGEMTSKKQKNPAKETLAGTTYIYSRKIRA